MDLHSLRRSYATHLIEDGWDPMFVQHQWATSTPAPPRFTPASSSDFRIRTLRRVLDRTINDALSLGEEETSMKRRVDYTWRLAELMAAHGMHNSTDLIPRWPNAASSCRGPQVYRVVHQRPERVSLQLMAALCDIFGCGVEDLVTVTATDVRKKKTASAAPLRHAERRRAQQVRAAPASPRDQ